MKEIPFKQFLRTGIERPEPILHAAEKLIQAGCRFEMEMLPTGMVKMECIRGDEVIARQIFRNGPSLPSAVDTLVTEAFQTLCCNPALVSETED